jgi:hypothetical protein
MLFDKPPLTRTILVAASLLDEGYPIRSSESVECIKPSRNTAVGSLDIRAKLCWCSLAFSFYFCSVEACDFGARGVESVAPQLRVPL